MHDEPKITEIVRCGHLSMHRNGALSTGVFGSGFNVAFSYLVAVNGTQITRPKWQNCHCNTHTHAQKSNHISQWLLCCEYNATRSTRATNEIGRQEKAACGLLLVATAGERFIATQSFRIERVATSETVRAKRSATKRERSNRANRFTYGCFYYIIL